MVEVVRLDRFGRVVLPKDLRDRIAVDEGSLFIVIERGQGQLLLRKLDVDELVERLEAELAGKDVDAIVEAVRREINEKIKAKYPDLLAR
jgi:AbrB family looped-hinge helix DNA binding protein